VAQKDTFAFLEVSPRHHLGTVSLYQIKPISGEHLTRFHDAIRYTSAMQSSETKRAMDKSVFPLHQCAQAGINIPQHFIVRVERHGIIKNAPPEEFALG
jgi:hypothetical protein